MTPTPNKDPIVILNGNAYTVKFGPTAEYMVDFIGVDLSVFLRSLGDSETRTTPKKFSTFLGLFSAMVAHNFIRMRQEPMTPQQWAMVLEDMSDEDRADKIKEIVKAVMDVMLPKIKASAQTVKLQEPAPKRELEPLQ